MRASTSTMATEPQSLWFRVVDRSLKSLQFGQLILIYQGSRFHYGNAKHSLRAEITVHQEAALRDLVLKGSIGAAESFVLGDWTTNDLTAVVRIFAQNLSVLESKNPFTSFARKVGAWADALRTRNTRTQAKKNIAAHYDLGNELFERFLDPSMMYSAAYYPSKEASLEEAQQYRLQRICEKLALSPNDHLLEIGTGWGGMAVYAAKHYGCRVTTTTISEQQYAWTQALIEKEQLGHLITLLKQDYRDLEGQYDKLVSIEMIEAVGHQYFDTYFKTCSALLKPDGLMLIQAITIGDQRYDSYRRNVDFIQKYIFPGGALPSIQRMTQSIAQNSDMVIRHLEDFGEHYAWTLAEWKLRFNAASDELKSLGYDQQFQHLWNYYFSYCEGGFLEHSIGVSQLVMAKPLNRLAVVKL